MTAKEFLEEMRKRSTALIEVCENCPALTHNANSPYQCVWPTTGQNAICDLVDEAAKSFGVEL